MGVLGAFLSSGYLSTQLYEVKAIDPLTLVAVPAAIMLASLLATLHPARQAACSDQLTLMRES